MLTFVDIDMGRGGLPACQRCAVQVQPIFRVTDDVLADVRVAVRQQDPPGPNLSFGGVEPFLHPDLPFIVREAVSHGARRIRLVTGAAALAVGQNAAGSLDAGVRHLDVLVLAGSAEVHDELSGKRAGVLQEALAGVERFLDMARTKRIPVAITGTVPVCEHNRAAVAEAVGALSACGVLSVVVDVSGDSQSASDPGWLAAVADTGLVNRTWVSFRGARPVGGFAAGGPHELHRRAPWSAEQVSR